MSKNAYYKFRRLQRRPCKWWKRYRCKCPEHIAERQVHQEAFEAAIQQARNCEHAWSEVFYGWSCKNCFTSKLRPRE